MTTLKKIASLTVLLIAAAMLSRCTPAPSRMITETIYSEALGEERTCCVYLPENFDPDEFELEMIDYGVDEIFEDEDGVINLYGSFDAYGNIQKYLEENKYDIVSGEFTRIPTDTKELTPEQRAEVDKILDKLDEDDDVTNVYHNIKED